MAGLDSDGDTAGGVSVVRLAAAVLCLAALSACGRGATEVAAADATLEDSGALGVTAPRPGGGPGELELLERLGYGDRAREAVPGEEHLGGVVLHEADAVAPGLNLITDIPRSRAELIDAQGEVLRSWHVADTIEASRFEMLANGDVIALARDAGLDGLPLSVSLLERQTLGGEVLWRRRIPVHHDVHENPDGSLWCLLHLGERTHERTAGKVFLDHGIARLSTDGELLESASLFDLLLDWPGSAAFTFQADLFHTNSIQPIDRTSLEGIDADLPADGTFLVLSIRNQNLLLILHWETAAVVWSWGPGTLLRQHDAQALPNGHIGVFDNGLAPERPWSRILEIDPTTNEIVWSYTATPRERFFSDARGTCQWLPNGNVLIGSSNTAEALEVTPAGTLAWRYLNPHRDDTGARGPIRLQRYPRPTGL